MKQSTLPDWTVPLALLVASILAFGITIPWLGLYADDWPFVYVNHLAGLRGVVDFISWVRPVAAWVFAAASALVGTNLWLVHVLLLLLRWLDAVLLWRLLRTVWPQHPHPALWAALLFAVYPAFKQQPLALEYVPHFVALAFLFFSLQISAQQASADGNNKKLNRRESAAWSILAWLGSLQVFILEYFVGLEALRPVIVWLVLSRHLGRWRAAKRAAFLWLPYLPVLIGFLLWRVFVVGFPSYQPVLLDQVSTSPLAAGLKMGQTILHDLWTAGVAAWVQPLTHLPGSSRILAVWGALVGTAFIAFIAYLFAYTKNLPAWLTRLPFFQHGNTTASKNNPGQAADIVDAAIRDAAETNSVEEPAANHWGLEYISTGVFAMLAAGWPFWITNLPLSLDFPWDRTSLAFMVGACLLAAGLVGALRWRPAQAGLVALLAAASIGLHFQNANTFRQEWTNLTSFYWQLSWRAPGFASGTMIILDQPPFNYHVDKFLWPLLNWTYAPDSRSLETPYGLRDFHKLWGSSLPPKTASDPLILEYGTLAFHGDTGRVLLVVYDPPGCLRVLTPEQEGQIPMSDELAQSLPLTNLKLIDPAPQQAARPPAFLGPEPDHSWCYFYEKANLAAQMTDWDTIADLGDQALALDLTPRRSAEGLLFAEAYAHLGRWEEARNLAMRAVQDHPALTCDLWQRLGGDTAELSCQ